MTAYVHSVTLDKDKCLGCTNCIKHCPTEAIRVRDGKATIIDERCIDCGECIRICPHHAKKAITDPLESIKKFTYPIALPAPTLYGQFPPRIIISQIMAGFKKLGFYAVREVARGAEIASLAIVNFLAHTKLPKPVLSSACPAVLRLVQVRYPELLEHVIPLESPMEITAWLTRQELEKRGLPPQEIGIFFISPCAAKVTSVKSPLGMRKSHVDGVISLAHVYGPLLSFLTNLPTVAESEERGGLGIGWAVTGGECRALGLESYLAVDGIANVARVLDDVTLGKLKEVEFIEGLACAGGCVGGPLTIANPYLAKSRLNNLVGMCKNIIEAPPEEIEKLQYLWTEKILPRSVLTLDEDLTLALQKMELWDKIHRSLPGLDCGSCGAPTCRALAEDIVRGLAVEIDCIFKLREKVTELAERMVELSSKLPPSLGKGK